MKEYSEIGRLIEEGKTSTEIRSIIRGFPFNPSVAYFMRLGYEESTAKEYRRMLEKNDEKLEKEEFEFIFSKDANPKKLILDTCALGYKKTIELIEEAEDVTVLLATIREMDTKKDIKKATETGKIYLAEKIRFYSKKFLVEEKYRMVPFDGINKDDYHDDIVIQYLMIMPVKDRPTILTSDANLAVKAKCYGLEYILYNPETLVLKRPNNVAEKNKKTIQKELVTEPKEKTLPVKKEKSEESKQLEKPKDDKIVVNGIELQKKAGQVCVKKYNKTAIIMQLMDDGKYQEVLCDVKTMLMTEEIVIIAPTKKISSIYISRIQIKDGNMTEETKQYFYLNEIYIEKWISEEIAEKVKTLF